LSAKGLTDDEYESLRFQAGISKNDSLTSQFATSNEEGLMLQITTSNRSRGGRRYLPYVFTEYGALMAANVFYDPTTIQNPKSKIQNRKMLPPDKPKGGIGFVETTKRKG
jgi:hypothetical protein